MNRKNVRRIYKHLIYPLKGLMGYLFIPKSRILVASIDPYQKNWGDNVSSILATLINPNNKYITVGKCNHLPITNYLCIGSIITWMANRYSIIWGTGVINPNIKLHYRPKQIVSVRGPLTREYFLNQGVDCPEIYGDPALLFPLYYNPILEKKYRIGIIAHFKDKENVNLKRLLANKDILFIDVEDIKPWTNFINNIISCESICSSSLHGLIIADAYKIKNRWIEFSQKEEVHKFKYMDYYLSTHRKIMPYQITENTSFEDLIESTKEWDVPQIDVQKILKSCPFYSK